jgi:PAS domain-containing protein
MAGTGGQRPLELILARNLLASLSTPALLVNREGDIVFFNDAASVLLAKRFEETGPMSAPDWTEMFGPLDDEGQPIPVERQPLAETLWSNRPGHARHRIRSCDGAEHRIAVSGVPIVGNDGSEGAMLFFWAEDG